MIENEFLIMRHSHDDHNYIDNDLNPSLTKDGIETAKIAAKSIAKIAQNAEKDILIKTSSKKRTLETAEIVAKEFDISQIGYEYEIDKNLNELYRGKKNLEGFSHERKIQLLESAWNAYDSEVARGNEDYRFGQPDELLLENFVMPPYGENFREYSARMNNVYLKLIGELVENKLPIYVMHRGGIKEIVRLNTSINEHISHDNVQLDKNLGYKYAGFGMESVNDLNFAIQSITSRIKGGS